MLNQEAAQTAVPSRGARRRHRDEKRMPLLLQKQEMTRGCRSTVYLGGRSPRSEPWDRFFVVSDVLDGVSLN
jgi:hypothetical protein